MTTVQPEQTLKGTCTHCARQRALRPDGTVTTHYLRYGNQEPRLRKRCPGSKCLPREDQR